MFNPGIEPGTVCVLGRRDNHYTNWTSEIDEALEVYSYIVRQFDKDLARVSYFLSTSYYWLANIFYTVI